MPHHCSLHSSTPKALFNEQRKKIVERYRLTEQQVLQMLQGQDLPEGLIPIAQQVVYRRLYFAANGTRLPEVQLQQGDQFPQSLQVE